MTWGSIINNDFNTCSLGQLLAAGCGSFRVHARPLERLSLEPTCRLRRRGRRAGKWVRSEAQCRFRPVGPLRRGT